MKYEDLDQCIFNWLTEGRARNIPISGPILQQKATEIAMKMGIHNFQASNGWLQKFKPVESCNFEDVWRRSGVQSCTGRRVETNLTKDFNRAQTIGYF